MSPQHEETLHPSAPHSAAGAETPETPEETTPSLEAASEAPENEVPAAAASAEAAAVESVETPPSAAEEHPAEESEEMDKLLEQYSAQHQAQVEHEPVKGRVVAFTDLGVVVDIGGKSESLIPAQEFMDAGSDIRPLPGEEIEVYVLDERKDGYILLSYLRALRRRIWQNIEKSHREKTLLSGKVLDLIKGGLVVDIGIRAFLPASQVDMRPVSNLEEWKDREISCRVLKMNRKRGNVVVSRRAVLEDELKGKRDELLGTLAEGAVVKGTVKNLTDYGAFVDLGGLDGLLHMTDISWGRIAKPSDVLASGQEIEVKILKFDREKMRVSLGMKQLTPDPWEHLPERYPAGHRVTGKVISVTDYGAFVEVEPGVEGLVHVSEMSWSKRAKHPSKIVSPGDMVEVQVLEVKPDVRRISLGLKQTMPDPWEKLTEKYPEGTVITGKVRNLTDFGAFVEIEEGIDGLIHVSDIRWTERVKHPGEVFKKGDTVEAKVLKIDRENRRLSLGVKQLNDIWAGWFTEHKIGDVVRGRVVRAASFGFFVELAEGIEGLCHISEVEGRRRDKGDKPRPKEPSDKPATGLEVGQEYDFKIVKLSQDQHKIGLSYRAAARQAERKEIAQYRSSKSSPYATIGDMILSKRNAS